MKLKDGFVLREVAGECVVVAVDADLNMDGMITLNSTAKTLWTALQNDVEENDLVNLLVREYDVSEDLASQATKSFIAQLKELDFLA